jgi:hypothetical protein
MLKLIVFVINKVLSLGDTSLGFRNKTTVLHKSLISTQYES